MKHTWKINSIIAKDGKVNPSRVNFFTRNLSFLIGRKDKTFYIISTKNLNDIFKLTPFIELVKLENDEGVFLIIETKNSIYQFKSNDK